MAVRNVAGIIRRFGVEQPDAPAIVALGALAHSLQAASA